MIYTKEVLEKVAFVNEVLDGIGVPHLLDNPDFSVDYMSVDSWLKIDLNAGSQNKVELSLVFAPNDLEIRIDRVSEAHWWADEHLQESTAILQSVLKNLFTSHVLVEYYGPHHTVISLFGQDGKCTNRFKYHYGFTLVKGKREDRLYSPIYHTGIDTGTQ